MFSIGFYKVFDRQGWVTIDGFMEYDEVFLCL